MAVYILFNPEKEHTETCKFEVAKEGVMGFCSAPAIGQRGKKKVIPLCGQHFRFCSAIENVRKHEIRKEK
jgi:hypothetical protein